MAVFITGGQAAERVNYVGWLRSDGAAHINTNFYPNQNTKVVIKFRSTSGSNTNFSSVFGCQTAWQNKGFSFGTYTACYGSLGTTNDFNFADGEEHTVEFGSDNGGVCRVVVDGVQVSGFQAQTFQADYPMYLFGNNEQNTTLYPSKADILYAQIYDSGNLAHDYWPCYDSDGVACMYDKTEEKYCYNAGAGEFVAGGNSGGDDPEETTITFSVAGTSYTAKEGMTWAQFVNSSYNNGKFSLSGGNVRYYVNGFYCWVMFDGAQQTGSTVIVADSYYNIT